MRKRVDGYDYDHDGSLSVSGVVRLPRREGSQISNHQSNQTSSRNFLSNFISFKLESGSESQERESWREKKR